MWLQSVIPSGIATTVPTIRPSRIDTRRTLSGAKRSSAMMTARVKKPMPTAFGSPNSGPVPPPNQPAATRISDTPMMRMMVPVTSGGKKRISFPNTGASAIMNNPQAMTEP
jgi:hypothetical protein